MEYAQSAIKNAAFFLEMDMNRYDAADIGKFAAGTEVSIARDHSGAVHYGLAALIDDRWHGVRCSVGSKDYSNDDLLGMVTAWWQMLAEEGFVGSGRMAGDPERGMITLTGNPFQDHLQLAYADAAREQTARN
jgi:hypothetical protein